jgi:galactokinase
VNIIGDHIDYMLFSCLPAAIERDALIACRVTPSPDSKTHVNLSNVDPRFHQVSFDFEASQGQEGIVIDRSKLDWSNYFKASRTRNPKRIESTNK